MVPSALTLPPKDYDDLLAILKWDQSMPDVMNDYLGDRYGDYIGSAIRDHIPLDFEDWEYLSHVDLTDDKITVVVGIDNGDDINVPVFRGE